jgi:hypothetical protein
MCLFIAPDVRACYYCGGTLYIVSECTTARFLDVLCDDCRSADILDRLELPDYFTRVSRPERIT